MKLIVAFFVALFGASPLLAQECGLLCDKGFWNGADVATVQAQIDAGADVNGQGVDGMTPIFLGLRLGQPDVTAVLLDAGVDVNARIDGGLTPLHLASMIQVVKLDRDAQNDGYLANIRLLLEVGADVHAISDDDVSVLFVAINFGIPEVIEILVEAGADTEARSNGKWTALHIASKSSGTDHMIAPLLAAGADVHARGGNGVTALHFAAVYRSSEITQLLLDAGAGINALSNNGDTALMSAASVSIGLENLTLLIEAGADVNIARKDGWTALHSAALEGEEGALLLLEAGADGMLKTEDGDTPFDLIKDDAGLKGGAAYLALEAASLD